MWSPETEALRDSYMQRYATSQTLWAITLATALAEGTGLVRVNWVGFGMAGVLASWLWRRSWKKYRAAYMAETDATIERAKREAQRFLKEPE